MNIDEALNFRKVNDSISTAGLLSEEQLNLLGQENYEAVIDLLPQYQDNAIKNERRIVEDQGIEYENIPVDFSAPLKSDYYKFASKMDACSGKKLMLHCAANYRVSAFYAIHAFHNLGWSIPQAYEFIHSVWNLDEYPVWESFVAEMLEPERGK